MRIYLTLSLLCLSLSSLAKEELMVCPIYHYSQVKKIVLTSGDYDKFKHCAISCLLTLRCPAVEVLELGVLKELVDTIGPGNAEFKDLQADYDGVAFVSKGQAKTDQACLNQCHGLYPKNFCQ